MIQLRNTRSPLSNVRIVVQPKTKPNAATNSRPSSAATKSRGPTRCIELGGAGNGVAVGVALGDGVGELVGVLVGVWLGIGVEVEVGEGVKVAVFVGRGVKVIVSVGLAVGVYVAVLVGDGVKVSVLVGKGVTVSVGGSIVWIVAAMALSATVSWKVTEGVASPLAPLNCILPGPDSVDALPVTPPFLID